MIRIKNLSKKYGNKTVLDDINLSTEEGKVYGIIGKNGAGKTTLFRCIAGLENYQGTIHSDLTPLKDSIGLLETQPYFIPYITGAEHLKLLLDARKLNTELSSEQNIFGLPLDEYAQNYSTGMKKKLALTAILLQQNEVYILDEPFSGVDLESNLLITAMIRQLRSLGKTVLISSHLLSSLAELCDEIYLLEEGQIQNRIRQEEFQDIEKFLNVSSTQIQSKIASLNSK